ncbi:MAG: spermidine synthase [Rickettsiales bacterium]|nr:spermidine synthase [Rickettsiales bacterium]
MKKFFKEKLHANLVQEIKIKKILVNTRSKFQKIEIFDTYIFGRIMALDGIIQITEKDESAYSEMLVHPIVQTSLNKPKKTLIIGGGDGAVAEELLKYSFIKKIDLVDIDKKVIDLCKKYFKKINNNSLSNKKVSLFYDDAFNFIKNSKEKYDIVIADRPDPIGAGKSLYKTHFYKNIQNILSNEGSAIFQSGVPFLQKKELTDVLKEVKKYFKNSGVLLTVVPSYIGGYMALVWASNNNSILKNRKVTRKFNIKTAFYNKNILNSAFEYPNFLKSFIK